MALKNIIKIVLFGIIAFIMRMAASMAVSVLGTFGVILSNSVGAFLCAPIVLVMSRKIQKRGTIFMFYVLTGLIYSAMGFWPMLVVLLMSAIGGELIIGRENNYQNNRRIGMSYIVAEFIYALHGYMFFGYFGIQGLSKQFPGMFTEETAKWMYDTIFAPQNLVAIIALQIVLSVLGVIFGNYIYEKFFAKNHKDALLN